MKLNFLFNKPNRPSAHLQPQLPLTDVLTPSLYVLNASSLAKPHALQQLEADLKGYDADVAVISETHFKKKHADSAVSLTDYTLARKDREGRRGGGVAVYARKNLTVSVINFKDDMPNYELLWINITGCNYRSIVLGAIYHPPRPIYDTPMFLTYIENCILDIFQKFPNSGIALAGDVNTLPDSLLLANTGLISIVNAPTRGGSCLDKIFVSEPLYENVKICKSSVHSDHLAIIVHNSGIIINKSKLSTVVNFRRKTPTQHAAFLSTPVDIFNDVYLLENSQDIADCFYQIAGYLLDKFYPMKTVSITSADPDYMTPEIKFLLRKKNILMHSGKIEEASAVAGKIGKEIARRNSASLNHLGKDSTTNELWQAVRQVTGKNKNKSTQAIPGITATILNDHYSAISTDTAYSKTSNKSSATPVFTNLGEFQIFYILDNLHHTAEGLDKLPAWFLRIAAPLFSKVVTYLFNSSLSQSHVPAQWKSAIIHPIPKTPNPSSPSDFRPISVVPILSRIIEKIIVRTHLYPILQDPLSAHRFADQFAFRPTGSTTATILLILQHITTLLAENNPYVTLISLDFSKAFDSVRHSSLLEKIASLPVPDNIFNWINSYLEARTHSTLFQNDISSPKSISASIVQGSGIGPFSFLITASDLSPILPSNELFKFADDMYLIVPFNNRSFIDSELKHIASWAESNNLKLNHSKSTEILFSKKRTKIALPPPIPGINRETSIVILGVHIDQTLSMEKHILDIISSCSQSLYALRMLKSNGLANDKIFEVFQATTLSKLLYASPSWHGFINASLKDRLEAFLRKSKRLGFCSPELPTIHELFIKNDTSLFKSIVSNKAHVLYPSLPPIKPQPYNLRPRAHNFVLPVKDNRNFLQRMLFYDV